MDIEFRNPVSTADGNIDMEINHPEFGWIPFTASPNDTEQLGRDLYAAASLGVVGTYTPMEPDLPIEAGPVRTACVLRVSVEDNAVLSVGGSFRVAAMIYLDTGTFLAVFSRDLGSSEPYVIPNNGVSIAITEWGGDYAIFEIRGHAGGSLITPSTFGFSLYNF